MNKRIIFLRKLGTLLNLIIKRRWDTLTSPLIDHLHLSLMWMTLLQFLLNLLNLLPHLRMFHFIIKTVPQILRLFGHILITPKLYIEATLCLNISTNTYRPCQLSPLEFMLYYILKLLLINWVACIWLNERLTVISLIGWQWDRWTWQRGINFYLFILKIIYCQIHRIYHLSFLCHAGILSQIGSLGAEWLLD